MYSDYFERDIEISEGDKEMLLDIYEDIAREQGFETDYEDRRLVDFEEDTALLDTVLYHVHTFGRNHENYEGIAHVFKMTFEEFLNAPRGLAMAITVEEYKSIKPLLQEAYSAKDIEHIDDYCLFKPGDERFLLCNLEEKSTILTPMMYINAVTFVDRVPFKDIVFQKEMDGKLENVFEKDGTLKMEFSSERGVRDWLELNLNGCDSSEEFEEWLEEFFEEGNRVVIEKANGSMELGFEACMELMGDKLIESVDGVLEVAAQQSAALQRARGKVVEGFKDLGG